MFNYTVYLLANNLRVSIEQSAVELAPLSFMRKCQKLSLNLRVI